MALVPQISLSISGKCNKFSALDQTGPYHALNNPGGWGTPNIDTADITESLVLIYDSTGATLLETYDVTSVYAGVAGAPTPGASFVLINEESWTQADGIYQVKYKITDDPDIFWNETQHVLFTCNLCACMQKLIHSLLEACTSKETEKLKTQADQLEIFLYGIQCAFACGDFDTAEQILEKAALYCQTISDCGCGCGGC